MSLNQSEIAYLCRLLQRDVAQGAIQKIHEPQDGVFVIESYGGECGRARLTIDLKQGAPLFYLAKSKLKNPETPTALCTLLRKHLTSARIRDFEAFQNDRIFYIRMEKMTDQGVKERRLVVELIPGYPTLLLLDENLKVLAATQSIRNNQRSVGRGDRYVEPTALERKQEDDILFAQFEEWNEDNIFSLLEESNAPKVATLDTSSLRKDVERALKRQRKKVSKIEADLRKLQEQEGGADLGELLKSALGKVRTGMSEIAVRDWGQEGEVYVTIPLDSAKTPQENLEFLFAKAKKSARGQELAKERLDSQRETLRALQKLEEDLANKSLDPDTLIKRATSLGIEAGTKLAQPTSKKKKVQPKRKPYKTYISKDGLEIYVGRTSRDNDEVTFQHCKGNEWWFHADGYPGSHVVVKTSSDLPQETLLDAATLAVEYSKANSGGKQAVSYTQRKNVAKYKGARPGQVILKRHKTILVRFEPDRLERLQKSRPGAKD